MEAFVLEGMAIQFQQHLLAQERSPLTVEKYMRDVRGFLTFLEGRALDRQLVLDYKRALIASYKPTSVNSILAALGSFFSFCGCGELKVKALKLQRRMFAQPERELSREEYKRLLHAAKQHKNQRLNLIMQTMCSTGIRVSELKFITVEAVKLGRGEVNCKGKRRTVFLNGELRRMLSGYIKQQGLDQGCVFVTCHGNPISRHHIWAEMKALCVDAKVDSTKVFPHNLRHLFARTFYSIEKDLGRLADVLGHSNINTTRIYTMDCGQEHQRILRRLSLVFQ